MGSGHTIRTVRPATAADDPERVFDLLRQLAPDAPRPAPARLAAAWRALTAQPGRRLLLAESGPALVGTLDTLVLPNLTHDARPHMLVENVVVDAAHRRQGIATALFTAAVELAGTLDCYKIQLLSNRTRAEAHAVYERLGFAPSAAGYRRYL